MKQHAFDTLAHTHNPEKWHHRNFPTLWPAFLSVLWTFMHLFMPFMIHYLTDKYDGKWHKVIVDTIYAAVTMTLLFTNVGILLWLYLYYTPADVDLRIATTSHVTSGKPMDIQVTYANPYRTIKDAQIHIDLPPGFLGATGGEHNTVDALLGTIRKGDVQTIPVRGVIFGNVGETYTARVVMVYSYLGNTHEEVLYYHFSVKDSTIEMSVDLPSVAVYGREFTGTVRYVNHSTVSRKNAEITLLLPDHFVLTRAVKDGQDLNVNTENNSVRLNRIESAEEGAVDISGYFSLKEAREHNVFGDQEVEIRSTIKAAIDSKLAATDEQFTQDIVAGTIAVVNPRAVLSVTSPRAIHFGDTWKVQLNVQNVGDTPITDIDLSAAVKGVSVHADKILYRIYDGEKITASGIVNLTGGGAAIPRIPSIQPGKTGVVTLSVPTFATMDQRVQAFVTTSGSVYAPEIETRIPLIVQSGEVKFHSRVSASQEVIYYSPEGEQLGYGPLPLEPWKTTAFRVLLNIQNINNDLSNVHVFAKLSKQAEWTDLYSYSAGTAMSFDKRTQTVYWKIPDLSPQSEKYGGQFEVLITPNILQLNKAVPAIDSLKIIATDAFTGETFTLEKGVLNTPAKVIDKK